MEKGRFREIWANLETKNIIYLFIIIVMACIIVISTLFNFKLISKQKVYVMIPPYIKEGIYLGSPTYSLWWGRFFIDSISTLDPRIVDDRLNFILSFTNPKKIKKIKQQFEDQIGFIKKSDFTQIYLPDANSWRVTRYGKSYIVSSKGKIVVYVGKKKLKEEKHAYWVQLSYNNGVVYLEDFGHGKNLQLKK